MNWILEFLLGILGGIIVYSAIVLKFRWEPNIILLFFAAYLVALTWILIRWTSGAL